MCAPEVHLFHIALAEAGDEARRLTVATAAGRRQGACRSTTLPAYWGKVKPRLWMRLCTRTASVESR